MHGDAIQQLEVALLGPPAAEVLDLSSGLSKSKQVTVVTAQAPHTYTATPPTLPPTLVPKPDEEIWTTSKTKISDIPVLVSKCHYISTTLISPSVSVKPSPSFTASSPVIVVSEPSHSS